MNAGGLSQRIVDLPMKLVGHRPGGLGYVGVLAAMIMQACPVLRLLIPQLSPRCWCR